jgi:hypothetical protein
MKAKKNSPSIDVDLYLSSSLFTGNQLQRFQNALIRLAPDWASKLHLWRSGEPPLAIDITRAGAMERVMLSKGIERGKLFGRLEKLAPLPDPDRRFGSMELRGAYPGLTVVLGFDDWIFCPIGTSWIPGNRIAIQVRSSQIEQSGASKWAEECISLCCTMVDPFFAFACATEEYAAKNLSTEGGGLRAIGIDIAKHLPGVYWLTFFGPPYRTFIGDQRLLSAPTEQVTACGPGYIVKLSADPAAWRSSEYGQREVAVRQHLGPQYFFSREFQNRETVSPFSLPKLSPTGKLQAIVDMDGLIKHLKIENP